MIWLWIYLVAGVVSLVVIYGTHLLERQENKTSQLLESMRGPLSTKDMLLEKVIAPALGSVLVVIAWPAVVVYAIKTRHDARLEQQRREDAVFRVKSKDILRQTSVPEVEAVANIVDPMRAVPDLPFGHLHSVWQSFLNQRLLGAELWAFSCEHVSEWGHVTAREGYVWVLDDERAPWILTSQISKERDDE
ncbi:MAG: hypothetical protein ACOYB1_14680 [Limnohabitans sp.]